MGNIQNRAMEIVNSGSINNNQEEACRSIDYRHTTGDIPKIFWKYFDLYRRKRITLTQYSENTGLSISTLERFLKGTVERSAKSIENAKEL